MLGKGMMARMVMCATWVCWLGGCGSCDEEQPNDVPDMITSPADAARDLDPTPDMRALEDMTPEDMSVDLSDMGEVLIPCDVDGPDDPQRFAVAGWDVEVKPRSGAWSVSGPGGSFASSPSPCAGGVRVATGVPRVQMAFGAWKIGFDTQLMMWREVASSAPTITPSGDTLTLSWPLAGEGADTVSLVFSPHGAGDLSVQLETDWADASAGGFSQRCEVNEAFFGLGTQTTGMDLRGGTYPLWTQEQGIDKPEDGGLFPLQNVPEAAYAPMGVLHSSRGWSALLKPDTYTELDLCERDPDLLATTTYKQFPGWVFVVGEMTGGISGMRSGAASARSISGERSCVERSRALSAGMSRVTCSALYSCTNSS